MSHFILARGGLAPWERRYLELAGYGPGDYIQDSFEHCFCRRMYVGELSHVNFAVRPSDVHWLTNRMIGALEGGVDDYPKMVFISRSDSSKEERMLVNEDEVFESLSELGFVKLSLASLIVDDQIRTMMNAVVVVATHGAGLSNIIYMRSGLVIEIHTDQIFKDHFFNLAIASRLRYRAFMAETDQGRYRLPRSIMDDIRKEIECFMA